MLISQRFGSNAFALGLMFLSALCVASDVQGDLEQRICSNMANEAQYVLDDSSDTTKYLSPYIAAEIYQQVVAKSLGSTIAEKDVVAEPSMGALPCSDTVSYFMMAIKKRMEYNRFDYFIMRYSFWIISILLLALVGGILYFRECRAMVKLSDN